MDNHDNPKKDNKISIQIYKINENFLTIRMGEISNDLNRVFKSHYQNILIKTRWNLYEVNSQTQPQPHYLYNIKGGFFEHLGYLK